ncbi:MAG: hydroxyacid dehydrogenase [Candidatus Kariarchaeaceae archaeon]|jgi:D-3-phosphoglycerate dehydrogenase
MKNIVIVDPLNQIAQELLITSGFNVVDISSKKEELTATLKTADAIIVRSATKITRDLLEQAPNLKIIGRAGVGLDNVDLEASKQLGIKVVNSPKGPTNSVAELTLGLIIAASRRLGTVYSETIAGNWPKKTKGIELYGKTLGILGSGAVGGVVAKICIELGMKILAYDIVKYDELERLPEFTYVELEDLYMSSDIISLHLPLLPSTKHLLNKEAFNKMKKGVLIINTARGGLIDENALLDALKSGIIMGAALDVYESEPVNPNNPLLGYPGVFTTAHVGAQTIEAGEKNARIVCEKIIEFLK